MCLLSAVFKVDIPKVQKEPFWKNRFFIAGLFCLSISILGLILFFGFLKIGVNKPSCFSSNRVKNIAIPAKKPIGRHLHRLAKKMEYIEKTTHFYNYSTARTERLLVNGVKKSMMCHFVTVHTATIPEDIQLVLEVRT